MNRMNTRRDRYGALKNERTGILQRSFTGAKIRTACLGPLALILTVMMTLGCQTPRQEKLYTPGTYTGKSAGYGGSVTATITVDECRITDAQLSGEGETATIGGEAMKTLAARLKEKGNPEIDAVSSATGTSTAVKEAVANALDQAKGLTPVRKIFKDGKYTTKVMGHEGYIHVATTFQAGAITACSVVAHEETMGIGNYAASRIPPRILKEQSIEVEAVSGATVSSYTIKRAVAKAIELAGGDVEKFRHKSTPQAVPKSVTASADVIVVGAGTAGLVAATRLAEMGKKVLVFEKLDIPGGAMATTYSGIMNSYSQLGASYGLGREKKTASWNKDLLMPIFKNYIHKEYDRFNGTQPYQNAMMDTSGKLVDWFHGMGIGFSSMGNFEGGLQYGFTPYLSPGCYQGGAGYALMFLAERITTLGGTIVYGTPVVALEKDGTGRISGVRAEGKDGKSWTATAKAVILATGGFGANREMVAQYYPDYKDHIFNTVAGSTGEGIKMGMAAGAALECMDRPLGAFMSAYGSNYELAFMHVSTPGIMVNVKGRQFGNITVSNHKVLARALLDPANERTFYYVFDDAGAESTRDFDAYGLSYSPIFDRGEALRYASVAEASAKLNLPDLAATIEENNRLALSGGKDAFGRTRLPYIETRDGVWMIRVIPTFYLSTGGLVIDTSAHVLDATGTAIPGLYAAGDVTGSIEEKDGKEYGNGFDAAMTYGYIAAETIRSSVQ